MNAGYAVLFIMFAAVCFANGWWASRLGRSRSDDPITLVYLQRGWRIGGRISTWFGYAFLASAVVVVILSILFELYETTLH